MNNETQELQDLLNISVRHVRNQGEPSRGADGRCVYRGPGGLQCAAGPFITDYTRAMDRADLTFHGVTKRWPDRILPVARKHDGFVSNVLQAAHDGATTDGRFEFMPDYHRRLGERLRNYFGNTGIHLVIPPHVAMGALTY